MRAPWRRAWSCALLLHGATLGAAWPEPPVPEAPAPTPLALSWRAAPAPAALEAPAPPEPPPPPPPAPVPARSRRPRPKPAAPTPTPRAAPEAPRPEPGDPGPTTPEAPAPEPPEPPASSAAQLADNTATRPAPSADPQVVLRTLLAQLEPHKRYPRAARQLGQEGTVVLVLALAGDGALRGPPEVRRSSGSATLDAEAARMAAAAAPFRGLGGAPVRVALPVRFTLE
jgi:protein TonB